MTAPQQPVHPATRLFGGPHIMAYTILLLVAAAHFSWSLWSHSTAAAEVGREGCPPARQVLRLPFYDQKGRPARMKDINSTNTSNSSNTIASSCSTNTNTSSSSSSSSSGCSTTTTAVAAGSSSSSRSAQPCPAGSPEGLEPQPQISCANCSSAAFAPYIVSRCAPGMPRYWAPCLVELAARKGICVLQAEELLYPDLELLLPGFTSKQQRDAWLAQAEFRGGNAWRWLWIPRPNDDTQNYMILHSNHGQNWVFCNARYTDEPFPDQWAPQGAADNHCMGGHNRVFQFTEQQQPEAGDAVHESLAIYVTPQAFSFQHFTDHATKSVMQGQHLVNQTTDILAIKSGSPQSAVRELWSLFPHVNNSRISFGEGKNHWAKELTVSCRVPFVAPYLVQRHQEATLWRLAKRVPLSDRKVVLWLGRRHGTRMIINEQEALEQIKQLLKDRNQGEELKVLYDQSEWNTHADWMKWVAENVRAMIGPHGGNLNNVRYIAPETLVLEFMPSQRMNAVIWQDAVSLLGNYHVIIYPSLEGGSHNMKVDVPEVISLLSRELGKPPRMPPIRHHYEWTEALYSSGVAGWKAEHTQWENSHLDKKLPKTT